MEDIKKLIPQTLKLQLDEEGKDIISIRPYSYAQIEAFFDRMNAEFKGVDMKSFSGMDTKAVITALTPYLDKVLNVLAGETGRGVDDLKKLTIEQLVELCEALIRHGLGLERVQKAFFDVVTRMKATGSLLQK